MSVMTLAPAADDFADPDAYLRGRADAYDDAGTVPLDTLRSRAAAHIAHHPHLAFALGYSDHVLAVRNHQDAVTAAQTDLAHTDHKAGTR